MKKRRSDVLFTLDVEGLLGRFDYSFGVKDRPVTFLTGLNGCGKTTLMKLLGEMSRGPWIMKPFQCARLRYRDSLVTIRGDAQKRSRRTGIGFRYVHCRVGSIDFNNGLDTLESCLARPRSNFGERVEVFEEMMKALMPDKTPVITEGVDFHFVTKNGNRPLEVWELSDGEKQMVHLLGSVMFTETGISGRTVFLVDGPEECVHIGAQKELVPLLERCLRARGSAHAIVATHSPFIVGERWGDAIDLTKLNSREET